MLTVRLDQGVCDRAKASEADNHAETASAICYAMSQYIGLATGDVPAVASSRTPGEHLDEVYSMLVGAGYMTPLTPLAGQSVGSD